MMGTSDEIKELLSKGTFISYENCVYLGGGCNVGKTTLASILIGEDIPQHWKSTDGLTIYFGRNGIDLKNKEMVPLKQGSDGDVLSKVLRGQPDMTQEKPDTTLSKNREDVQPQDSDKGNIIPEKHTIPQHKDNTLSTSTASIPTLVPGTGKGDVHITDHFRQQSQILKVSKQNYTTIQEDIKQEIRKGKYKIEIAPSDLVDFGGHRSYDMTHQLFMRHKGTFVLMFNGTIHFSDPLENPGETTESILKHWVNSILSYCTDDEDILPMIMFSATHSDHYNQEDRIKRKAQLIHNLGKIFKFHKRQHHIIYDDIFFINGKDKNDSEINRLKSKLVEVAFKQESWGKRMPMVCVPLDLQMSQMRLHNMNIISKEELTTLNQGNEDLALTVEQMKNFLNVQHSLGKILYFDQHGLDNFIVVQPQSLVNILRSFITAEYFWPNDEELRGILCTLTKTGKIAKQDLLKLWLQEKFHQHMPNDDFKEFIIKVLVHLDILVEPKHRQEQESYLVPCIVQRRLRNTDLYVKSADKMICLSYTLLKSSIPTALSFKLIGAALNVWPLKATPEGICLYHQAAILCIDESNELHLLVEDDKIFVYLINEKKKGLISPKIASMVQEFLTQTITKVLEFYHKSFGKSLSTSEASKAFEIEVGEWCTSGGGCYISVPEVKEKTEWLCKNNKTHDKTYPRYWIFDKKEVKCDENGSVAPFPKMGSSDEMKKLLLNGTFVSYENCVYLGGACNVGKTTLASILIGEKIPQHWKSTDGLTIYFGRNGIDLEKKEMVPLKQGSDCDVLSKVLRGKPDITQETPDTKNREVLPDTTPSKNKEEMLPDTTLSKNREEVLPDTTLSKNKEEVLPDDSNKEDIIPETHTIPQRKDITLSTSAAPNPTLVSGTGNDDVNITDSLRQQSPQNCIMATFLENIKEEIRKGTYKIEIAPSDLIDFGGQRSFDMTHQLFMRHKGTFVLMFNGTIDFSTDLKENPGETTESILIHWVNSILSFCVDDKDILPKIMFCATHSDHYNEEKREDRKKKLIGHLENTFKDHKQQSRIVYNNIFFINGLVKDDPEIKKLKSKLVEVAFESWDKQKNRMPMAWVPLDLQMSELRLHNMNIISKEELITLNQRNDDLALTDEQIRDFLSQQHSLGKMLYFDQQGLDNFIIVQPQSLVNILRSFITAKDFWPEDRELQHILSTLTETGQIPKEDLLKLWSQKKFDRHMPNDDFKEFIIQVLVHLDILVEPKYYNPDKESNVQSYLVPCIVKLLPDTNSYVKSADKMICLSYTLLKSSMPAALSFKLIGAAMNVWPLKKTSKGICLYHQAAILCIDRENELHILVKDNKIIIYLINKKTKCFISPNIASTVQECLTLTMKYVLEFYHKSFGKSPSISEVSNLFEIEVGEWCDKEACYLPVPEVKTMQEWKCKNKKHKTKFPFLWLYNKTQVTCDESCSGFDTKDLTFCPTDKHFVRLAAHVPHDTFSELVIHLGLSNTSWKNTIDRYQAYDLKVVNFVALCEWRKEKEGKMEKPSFKDLSDAVTKIGYNKHVLCQVFKENVQVLGIDNITLQKIPDDDVLRELSNQVANCAMQLGVELGLSMVEIEQILFEYSKNIFNQTFDVLKKWKTNCEIKPTIRILMKAMQASDPRGLTFLLEKYPNSS